MYDGKCNTTFYMKFTEISGNGVIKFLKSSTFRRLLSYERRDDIQ